jgi:hypothetical protein
MSALEYLRECELRHSWQRVARAAWSFGVIAASLLALVRLVTA